MFLLQFQGIHSTLNSHSTTCVVTDWLLLRFGIWFRIFGFGFGFMRSAKKFKAIFKDTNKAAAAKQTTTKRVANVVEKKTLGTSRGIEITSIYISICDGQWFVVLPIAFLSQENVSDFSHSHTHTSRKSLIRLVNNKLLMKFKRLERIQDTILLC